MRAETIAEARRQVEICNACRYCEGFCAVFPAVHRARSFAEGDLTQLANLCHNCRGCYYACQYTEPHEFALNLPGVLADLRQQSWEAQAWPRGLGKLFHRSGTALALAVTLGFATLLALVFAAPPAGGAGFYAYMGHGMMLAIFAPAFLLPLAALAVSLSRYWRAIGGARLSLDDVTTALTAVAGMRNLAGGHGEGCNYEDDDAYSNARRLAHQAVLWGFMLAFASTATGTVLHYLFDSPAPYGPFSLPKLFGVSGGLLMVAGSAGLGWLKLRADRGLGAARVWGGEMGFVALVFFVSLSGLALYAATGTALVSILLPLHLGAVLAFFLLTPYSKMAHGFYRLAALLREAQLRRGAGSEPPSGTATE